MSKYLSDQVERIHLLDYLASMYESMHEVSEALLTLDHGGLTDDEAVTTKYQATTGAMNLLADMRMSWPMLMDMYHDAGDDPY